MGSGKSTIGKKLAESLNYSFYDTDKQIELSFQQSISTIFYKYGERKFRIYEREILYSLNCKQCIIATGGGLPCHYNNLEFIQKYGISIYLTVNISELYNRLKKEREQRPLINNLSDNQLLEFIKKEVHKREILCYSKAHYIINAEKSINEIIHDIIQQIKNTNLVFPFVKN